MTHHHRTGLPLDGCPASNAIKGKHERNAYGLCQLCGNGPAVPVSRATPPSPSTARDALTLIKHSRDYQRLLPSSRKIIDDALEAPSTASEVGELPPLPKPNAWKHTMDNTEGIKSNRPHVVLTMTKASPFGRRGIDYSKSFPVTADALFSAGQMRDYGGTCARAALAAKTAESEAKQPTMICTECGTDRLAQPCPRRGICAMHATASVQPSTGEVDVEAECKRVEAWANETQQRGPSMDDVWAIYQHGKEAARRTQAEGAKDAVRYHWLRDPANTEGPNIIATYSRNALDSAIDAAIATTQKGE